MNIFDKLSETHDRLKKLKDKINLLELKADAPRSTVLSDMPRSGGNAGNPLEQYYIQKEELEEKYVALKERFEHQWKTAVRQMNAAHIDSQTQEMMYYRFVYCLGWKECAKKLNAKFPSNKWNLNKCFRKYREVLCKTDKNLNESL